MTLSAEIVFQTRLSRLISSVIPVFEGLRQLAERLFGARHGVERRAARQVRHLAVEVDGVLYLHPGAFAMFVLSASNTFSSNLCCNRLNHSKSDHTDTCFLGACNQDAMEGLTMW